VLIDYGDRRSDARALRVDRSIPKRSH
jgi:hypothetical protein